MIEGVSETERAWVAGFVDGEGSWTTATRENPKWRTRVRLHVYNTEMDPLLRCQKLLGGRIYEVTGASRPSHWKRSFMLCVQRNADVQRAMDLLIPYMSEPKFKQLNKALIIEDESGMQ